MYDTLTPFVPGASDGLSEYPDLAEQRQKELKIKGFDSFIEIK